MQAATRPARASAKIAPRAAGPRRQEQIGGGGVPWSASLLFLLLAVGLVLGFRSWQHRGISAHSSGTGPAPAARRPASPSYWVDPQYLASYQGQLATYLAGQPGKYSIATLDITTGAGLGINQDQPFRAASVNKLELAISLYRRALAHQIDLDATTVIAQDEVQNYGTGTIQLRGGGQSYTYRELATLMLEESDNTASYVIGKRLGLDAVQSDLQSWGLKQTSMADNYTTAQDVALLLSRVERRELLPEAQTAEILDLLQHTAWNDRLQAGVPPSLAVAHKIGTDVAVYNDAAIFLDGDHPYVAVVLSSGAQEDDALQTMTQVARLTYQFQGGLPAASRKLH